MIEASNVFNVSCNIEGRALSNRSSAFLCIVFLGFRKTRFGLHNDGLSEQPVHIFLSLVIILYPFS
jgi:hypothetical protein